MSTLQRFSILRAALCLTGLCATGCSFIDDFGSLSVGAADASVADLGSDAGVDLGLDADLGTFDAGAPDAGSVGRVVDIVSGAGAGHTCALFDSGRLRCWGYGGFGELGNGEDIGRGIGTSQAVPQDVVGLPGRVVAVTVGDSHTCAIVQEGSQNALFCWGDSSDGQFGDGVDGFSVSTPRRITASWQPVAVAAGRGLTCVVTTTREVLCTGRNSDQQLGSPNPGIAASAVFLATEVSLAPRTPVGIFAGLRNACIITSAGASACWGDNSSEQLGVADPSSSAGALDLGEAVSVAIGGYHICTLRSSGEVRCSGYGNFGQLGNGATPATSPQVIVMGGLRVNAITAGDAHTCAIAEGSPGDGVFCWGKNDSGQLGQGALVEISATPMMVNGVIDVVRLTSGQDHVCALTSAGEVYCWGSNSSLQLGALAATASSPTPIRVTGLD